MKKMIVALMAIVLMSTTYAQTFQKLALPQVTTEIIGDIALLYNGGVDPTDYVVNVKLFIDGSLHFNKNIYTNSNGMASISDKQYGELPFGPKNFEVIVTVDGSSMSTFGVLQNIPCHDYEDNYTFGLAIGGIPTNK